MAEESDLDLENDLEGEDGESEGNRRKRLIIIGAAVLGLLVLAAAIYFFFFAARPSPEEERKAAEEAAREGIVFVDMPEMVVNLRSPDGQNAFLKLNFALAAKNEKVAEELKEQLPAIRDAMQPFLRELRPEDLAGSAAVYRIKEEMTRRAIQRVGPDKIDDVMIQDMIQQ
jgi:flagellar FliL protein